MICSLVTARDGGVLSLQLQRYSPAQKCLQDDIHKDENTNLCGDFVQSLR